MNEVTKRIDENKAELYGFWKTAVIVPCGHPGLKSSHKLKEDFERTNGE